MILVFFCSLVDCSACDGWAFGPGTSWPFKFFSLKGWPSEVWRLGQIPTSCFINDKSAQISVFTILHIAVGTLAFDVRVGMYDDPPNKETVKMIKSSSDAFSLMGKLNKGWESFILNFMTTPTYLKFCEAQDTSIGIGQRIVDQKIIELKKAAEDGEALSQDQGW